MIFETHTLTQPLSDHIESIFHFKGFKPDHSIERVVPTGHLFIIFELDGFKRNTYNNETLEPNDEFTKVWISGMHKNYLSISAHEDSEMLVIQFKPNGPYPFLHIPIQELNDIVISSEKLFGDGLIKLRQDIISVNDSSEKLLWRHMFSILSTFQPNQIHLRNKIVIPVI